MRKFAQFTSIRKRVLGNMKWSIEDEDEDEHDSRDKDLDYYPGRETNPAA